ncbi:ubiquitin-ubiquitin ligase [Saccharomycopsis crataegensis]|uniref:RING-type E3 ubiquitin transferase n=1 Tax=Saccharomycopsis crataegensis TaxID=43959 RepID=A0AAV5QGD4_9ASCO|nr:ubiquitin-ubiquitin ligase [Saccharomycopsis crataegensis]
MSSEDDIRAKRIERLNLLAAMSASSKKDSDRIPDGEIANSSTITTASTPNPEFKQPEILQQKIVKKDELKTVTNSSSSALPSPDPKDIAGILKSWIMSEVSQILLSSFSPMEEDTDSRIFVDSSFSEISNLDDADSSGFVKLFMEDNLIDRVILENLTELGRPSPLLYLFKVWENAKENLKKVSKKISLKKTSMKAEDGEIFHKQKSVLNDIIRLTSSYGFLAFQVPDMYINGSEEKYMEEFILHISNPDFNEYCVNIIEEAKQQDSLLGILDIWFPALSKFLLVNKITDLNDQRYTSILNFYLATLTDKDIASVFTQIATFSADSIKFAPHIEFRSLLGPILRVAPLGEVESLRLYDRSSGDKSKYDIYNTQKLVATQHRNLLDIYLFPICDKIIRSGARSRQDLLKYFSHIINLNHLRVATQPDPSKLSTHGFICNISMILVKFSLPFLKSDFKKLGKIDIDYFNKNQLLDITEETRINSTTKEADSYFEKHKSTETPNFISDCFFLALTYLHYGITGLSHAESKITDLIGYLEKKVKALEAQKMKMSAANQQAYERMASIQIERLQRQLNPLKAQVDSLHCFFLNEEFQFDIFEYVSSSCVFFTRVIDPQHSFPSTTLKLPLNPDNEVFENIDNAEALREMSPIPFRYYPEFAIESIINYITYIIKYTKNSLQQNSQRLNFFIEFAVVLLRCPELISNPHLKGKLVESLFYGAVPLSKMDYNPGFMIQSFMTNKVVLGHMLYALLDFYVSVEKTGASSQFYDKFNSRYHTSVIIEKLWSIEHYRNQLKEYSEKNEDFFIRFVARMLNDTTYLLDESLSELSKIHYISEEIDKRTQSGDLETVVNSEFDGSTFEELNTRLLQSERSAKSFIGLSTKTIELFDLFTKEVPKAFTKSEIVNRLAGMLDYNLNQLVGPKYGDLKVQNPEKYQFNPRKLLTDISKIFVNLSKEIDFITAVARDGRSFKKELFIKAHKVLSKYGQLDSTSLDSLIEFANQAEQIKLAEEEEEEEWGDDLPEEYLDPLMYTLMVDPVILPSSKISIDRSTIKAHLLSDPTDPFNRVPLKLEQVVANTELKAKIDAFRMEKRMAKRAKKDDGDVEMKY